MNPKIAKAKKLRAKGHSWAEVAKRVGWASAGSARSIVWQAENHPPVSEWVLFAVASYLEKHGPSSARSIARAIGYSHQYVTECLRDLQAQGLVRRPHRFKWDLA